jgi:hypothetical protein
MAITSEAFFAQCHRASGGAGASPSEPDDLIGLFQTFRPDGAGADGVFLGLPQGECLHERLIPVFNAAGDPRRPTGGMDAYFIVRQPPPISGERVEALAADWLERLAAALSDVGESRLRDLLRAGLQVRVLEGKPPKHPRQVDQKCGLLRELERVGLEFTAALSPTCEVSSMLRQAYYFIACDPFLRDYLVWPIYQQGVTRDEPFAPYFELWRHGIKYRAFNDEVIDFYIPRSESVRIAVQPVNRLPSS